MVPEPEFKTIDALLALDDDEAEKADELRRKAAELARDPAALMRYLGHSPGVTDE
jgi:hypothetical protein